jgi:ribosomal protein S18 acetylase RimI-like enzyme
MKPMFVLRIACVGRLTVRKLQEGDEERLLEFYKSLSDETVHFYHPYPTFNSETIKKAVQRTITGEDLGLIAVDDKEQVIAHVFLSGIANDIAGFGIGVRDDFQGRGIGNELMKLIIRLAKHELRKKGIRLTVLKENKRAFHLYRKYGFEICGECTNFIENDGYKMQLTFG